MNISITIPDAIVPRFRQAVRYHFPEIDPDDTMTAKQIADEATAIYWRGIFVAEESRAAWNIADQKARAELAAEQARAATEATGIA
jgi:hypothetical protein